MPRFYSPFYSLVQQSCSPSMDYFSGMRASAQATWHLSTRDLVTSRYIKLGFLSMSASMLFWQKWKSEKCLGLNRTLNILCLGIRQVFYVMLESPYRRQVKWCSHSQEDVPRCRRVEFSSALCQALSRGLSSGIHGAVMQVVVDHPLASSEGIVLMCKNSLNVYWNKERVYLVFLPSPWAMWAYL